MSATEATPQKAVAPTSEPPLLDVVIVNSSGGRELLRDCLNSLARHPTRSGDMRAFVVDNASGDGSVEMVRSEFSWVELEQLSWNAGFCVANNVAIQRTTASFVLLLNPDTEVTEGALDHVLHVMEAQPEIGMASCRLVLRDGTFDHAAKRSFPTPASALGHFLRVGRGERAPSRLQQYRAPDLGEFECGEVDAVNGAFMLVRREALDEVGLLDEGYWLYMDDLDWCYRFKQSGWKVWYDGRVSIVHVKGGTTVHETPRARHRGLKHNIAFHRSMGRFYRKFYAGRQPLLDVAVYVAIGVKLGVSVTRSTLARRSLA